MPTPYYSRQFNKDVKKSKKRGKNTVALKEITRLLIAGQKLPEKNRDHPLSGNYVGHRECHIKPDWLLIYKLSSDEIFFVRTGTHSDLFR